MKVVHLEATSNSGAQTSLFAEELFLREAVAVANGVDTNNWGGSPGTFEQYLEREAEAVQFTYSEE